VIRPFLYHPENNYLYFSTIINYFVFSSNVQCKCSYRITDTAGNLSGGNIQRVMLARAFSQPVRFLIAHNPTRGLDIPSMEFIYRQILQRQEAGMATLLISENMDELFLLSNRIVAICNGEVMGELQRHEFDRYQLGRMMSGVKQGA
jgi:simple sugar transport system ATP-binding protein